MKLDLKKLGILGAVLLGSIGLTSCLNNDDEVPIPQDLGYVSFYNVSPDSNGLNFYSDDVAANSSLVGYSQFLNYLGIQQGNRKITVKSSGNVLDTLSLNVSKNRFYSVFATNKFNELELTAYEDAIATPAADKLLLRFIHLSPDTPQITVKIEGQERPIGNFNYKQTIQFSEASPILNKNIYLINTETQDTLVSKQVNLTSGKVYTVLALGLLNTTNQAQKLKIETIGLNL